MRRRYVSFNENLYYGTGDFYATFRAAKHGSGICFATDLGVHLAKVIDFRLHIVDWRDYWITDQCQKTAIV